MSIETTLARRYLVDRRHGAWGLMVSLLSTFGVTLGVGGLIVTLSVMTGFREDIRKKNPWRSASCHHQFSFRKIKSNGLSNS